MSVHWEKRFMELADHIAQWSKDRNSKVGAVIVDDKNPISVGYNGFPRGSDDEKQERHEKPEKYNWVLHAEENAIINAARHGHKVKGCDMYLNWYPCARCAGMVINAGIKRLFVANPPELDHPEKGDNYRIADEKLTESEVEVFLLPITVNRKVK
jgi:dCMP deaminase